MSYNTTGMDKKLVVPFRDYIEAQHPGFEFSGREEELTKLVRILHLPSTNSVNITGPKGVGRRSLLQGLVMTQNTDAMPNEFMVRPIYRLNTNMLFGSYTAQKVEENMNTVLNEMRKVYERRGVRPILAIEDGTNFVNNVTSNRYNNVMNALIDADSVSNYLDIILNADDQARTQLEKSYPTFLNSFTRLDLEEPEYADIMHYLRKHAGIYQAQGVSVSDEALEEIIGITNQYKNVFPCAQPLRSIRLLDEAATAYKLEMHSRPEGSAEKEAHLAEAREKMARIDAGEDIDFPESREVLETICETLPIELEAAYADFSAKKSAIRAVQDEIRAYDTLISERRADIEKMQEKDQQEADHMADQARNVLAEKATAGDPQLKGKTENEVRAMSSESILAFIKYDKNIQKNPEIRNKTREVASYDEAIRKLSEKVVDMAGALNYPVDLPPAYIEKMARKLTKTELNPNMFEAMANSEELLNAKVLGQESMIRPIASSLRRAATGRTPKNKPLGAFLILGPSGVGKTYIAEQIAKIIFGKEKFLSKVEMQYHKESHTVATLIGAPPGYAGYGDKGALIKKVQDNPYGVLLLDEIEKAHKDVKQTLLGALDNGVITGMDGEDADLRNNIIVKTSNYGQQHFLNPTLTYEEAVEKIKYEIYRDPENFSPEFLNRTTIVFADFLDPAIIAKIAMGKVKDIQEEVQADHPEFSISMDADSAQAFVDSYYTKAQGARIVKDILEQEIGDQADKFVLDAMKRKEKLRANMTVRYNAKEGFVYDMAEQNPAKPDASSAFSANASGSSESIHAPAQG